MNKENYLILKTNNHNQKCGKIVIGDRYDLLLSESSLQYFTICDIRMVNEEEKIVKVMEKRYNHLLEYIYNTDSVTIVTHRRDMIPYEYTYKYGNDKLLTDIEDAVSIEENDRISINVSPYNIFIDKISKDESKNLKISYTNNGEEFSIDISTDEDERKEKVFNGKVSCEDKSLYDFTIRKTDRDNYMMDIKCENYTISVHFNNSKIPKRYDMESYTGILDILDLNFEVDMISFENHPMYNMIAFDNGILAHIIYSNNVYEKFTNNFTTENSITYPTIESKLNNVGYSNSLGNREWVFDSFAHLLKMTTEEFLDYGILIKYASYSYIRLEENCEVIN